MRTFFFSFTSVRVSLKNSKENKCINNERAYLRVTLLKTENKRTSESEETDMNFIIHVSSDSSLNRLEMCVRYSTTNPQCVLL